MFTLISKLVGNTFNILGGVFMSDEQGIIGLHNNDIFQTDRRNEFIITKYQTVFIVDTNMITLYYQVVTVLFGENFVNGVPGADIAPTEVGGYNQYFIFFFGN